MLKLHIVKQFSNSSFSLDIKFKIDPTVMRAVFFGPSGSGKTLTMQSIAGIVKPDSGFITVRDATFYNSSRHIFISPQKRHIGYMLQDYALFPHLNILQNVAYSHSFLFGRLMKKKVREQALAMLERFKIAHLWAHYPNEISGGQKQRAALARAVNSSPSLLLFDEPFSALDPLLRDEMREQTLQLLQELSIPAIIISHDPDDVDAFANDLILFKHGKAKNIQNYTEIRKNYNSTKSCLMNLAEQAFGN